MSFHHLHNRLDALDHGGGLRPALVVRKGPGGAWYELPSGARVDADGLRAYELRHGVTREIIDDVLYMENAQIPAAEEKAVD